MEDDGENLHSLREKVGQIVGGKEVIAAAQAWAKERAIRWPHGVYSPYDFPCMYEAGYLRGYLRGSADMWEKAEAAWDKIFADRGMER